jgi:hypothetical protein
MLKPEVEESQVVALLSAYFDQPVSQLAPLGMGHVARVFSFLAGEQAYVIRLVTAPMASAFGKEMFVAQLLADSEAVIHCK